MIHNLLVTQLTDHTVIILQKVYLHQQLHHQIALNRLQLLHRQMTYASNVKSPENNIDIDVNDNSSDKQTSDILSDHNPKGNIASADDDINIDSVGSFNEEKVRCI